MKSMDFRLVIPLLAGWLSGWVVNYLADTLPLTRRLSTPICAHCNQPYRIGDYLLFRACTNCAHRRGIRPWLVQLAMLAVSLYTWFRPPEMRYGIQALKWSWLHAFEYPIAILLLTYFALVVVIDLEHRLILHPTSVVGALIALVIGMLLSGPLPTLEGGLAGLAIMLALYYLGVLFSKFRARRLKAAGQEADTEEALGAGDVILAAVLGLVLGWPMIWFALLLGILLGGIVGILLLAAMLLRGLYGRQALMVFMPYGPYFVLSAFIILFLPNWITGVLGR
jgi:leader peptidase (prepilin peptidase)/N-methyltransferase